MLSFSLLHVVILLILDVLSRFRSPPPIQCLLRHYCSPSPHSNDKPQITRLKSRSRSTKPLSPPSSSRIRPLVSNICCSSCRAGLDSSFEKRALNNFFP